MGHSHQVFNNNIDNNLIFGVSYANRAPHLRIL